MTATLKTGIVQEPSSSIANLTLSSSGGVTFGAAATTNTITSAASTALTIQSAGTTAMTIDTSQNVGIGTSSTSGQRLAVVQSNASGLIYTLLQNNAAGGNTGQGVQLTFSNDSGGGATSPSGYIKTLNTGGANNASAMAFGGYNGGSFVENMRIDSSGNVGIGVTPNTGWGSSAKVLQMGAYSAFYQNNIGYPEVSFNSYESSNAVYKYQISSNPASLYSQRSAQHVWYIAPSGTAGNTISFTQAMTLDTSGNLLVGTTSTFGKLRVQQSANGLSALLENTLSSGFTSEICSVRPSQNTTNGSFYAFSYFNNATATYKFYVIDSGAIYSTSTSITAISDQRHKENVRPLETGLADVLKLQPRRFDWKEGKGTDRKDVAGFIAQEVQAVLPDLVEEWKENKDDTEQYLGIRMTDMIPTLVKAIQELSTKVDAQAAEITALQAKVGA